MQGVKSPCVAPPTSAATSCSARQSRNRMRELANRLRDAFYLTILCVLAGFRMRQGRHIGRAKIMADPSVIARTIVASEGVVGSIGSWEDEGERDVGFWIGRDHRGNGYATAALRAFLDMELHRPLHAHVADHNVGSRRVLEKCGFVLDHSAQEDDVEHVLALTD